MLLHIDGAVVEIRPGELFESKSLVDSRYLEVLNKKLPLKIKSVVNKRSKSKMKELFKEELNGSSS